MLLARFPPFSDGVLMQLGYQISEISNIDSAWHFYSMGLVVLSPPRVWHCAERARNELTFVGDESLMVRG
jgi:hypothetical protein